MCREHALADAHIFALVRRAAVNGQRGKEERAVGRLARRAECWQDGSDRHGNANLQGPGAPPGLFRKRGEEAAWVVCSLGASNRLQLRGG